MARRQRVIDTLAPYLKAAYREISNGEDAATFTYSASWGDGNLGPTSVASYVEAIAASLEAAHRVDYERRMTTVGPHRDEPGFSIGVHDTRTHGSQGEQRTIALAVKLAAHSAVAESVNESPVLLLDDVFSELDPGRSASLAAALPSNTQTIITSARPEDLPVTGKVWTVEGGKLQ